MKTIIIILFTMLLVTNIEAQTVNGIPLSEIEVEYMQIVGTSKFLSTKNFVHLDFGQRNKVFKAKDTQLLDEGGKLIEFNSMIDALNFMTKNGYEYVNSYAITSGSSNVYHYLLRRIEK